MKVRNILYIILMVIFTVFAYFLFDRGFNVKTKIVVNYQEKSDLNYRVYLHDNDIYNREYLGMNDKYISKLVDNIMIDFNYNIMFDKDISGYYTYKVVGTLVAYQDDITDSLWEKEYVLLNDQTNVLNANDLKSIEIKDGINIDYDKYQDELNKFKQDYDIDVSGYLMVKVIIKENIDFFGIDKVVEDEKEIKMIIPLSYDTFKINVINDNNTVDKIYDFSKKEPVNYLLLIIGAFNLSLGISFLALTIRNMVLSYRKTSDYQKELRMILNDYSDIIVEVKRFYNKKKYNLIYVDTFKELMDVYNKVGNPISYREVKKDQEAIFIIIDDDNAWIYRLLSKDK